MIPTLFKQLNSSQSKAVEYINGSSIILAGAGSGKTRVLISKVLYLIEEKGVNPKSIIMITFTNKAASEMKSRIGQHRLGFIGTFHSLCVRIMRIEYEACQMGKDFVIYDESDQQSLIKIILKKLNFGNKYTPGYLQNRISAAKNILMSPLQFAETFKDNSAKDVFLIYQEYQKELKNNNAVDFDDLIMKVVRLFEKNKDILSKYQEKYHYILVDEFQDTNSAQYKLTKFLGDKYKNITVVGDFSQSIYSWRGAEIQNLEKFKQDFPNTKTFLLEENYRSTQPILDFAYSVISKNQTHPILSLYTTKKGGEEITFYEADNEEEEAVYIATNINNLKKDYQFKDISVLYRTNAQSRAIEEVFLHWGIPYRLVGGTRFYERKEIKDILSYLKLLINPVDQVAIERIIKLGKKRFKDFKGYYEKVHDEIDQKQTDQLIEEVLISSGYLELFDKDDEEDYSRIENIKELKSVALSFPKLGEFLEQVALVESEYFEGEKKNSDGIRLMTLHQAKGLEFEVVFVAGLEEGLLPHSKSLDDSFSLEEERRLFYVGITRAKKILYITYAKRRFIFGRRVEAIKSRFLEE